MEERTRSFNEAADLLAALTIGSSSASNSKNGGKIDCDEMEWKFGGGNLFRKLAPASDKLDSDDDSEDEETNPLKILATKELPTSRKQNSEKEDQVLSEGEDVSDSRVKSDSIIEDNFGDRLSKKVDQTKPKTQFLPFKSPEQKTERSKVLDVKTPIKSLRQV